MGELFDFQCAAGWDALPLVNCLWLDAQGFGQCRFTAKVLNNLVDVVGVHAIIVSILTYRVNELTVTDGMADCKIPSMNTLGQRIKQARQSRQPKMTQQQLADAVGVSRPAVTQWETGETRSLEGENLFLVARALGVTTDWLLYGTAPVAADPRSTRRVKVAVRGDQIVELDEESLRIALAMQSLSPKQRAAMQALVDSFAQSEGLNEADDCAACG